ncbi:SMI1/KNR4 family protein [Streptomyces sp. NPDC058284]|uniref:SMI1/KNR4 family protein n=1 Tax=unclassified Streptomyces TaxID=2593676 RepID=UPI00366372DB
MARPARARHVRGSGASGAGLSHRSGWGGLIAQSLPEPLLRHIGTGDDDLLPPFWRLLSVRNIASEWQLGLRIYRDVFEGTEENDPDQDFGPWWHCHWIHFAGDGGGDSLIIDQRPHHHRRGRIGEADHEQGTRFGSHSM